MLRSEVFMFNAGRTGAAWTAYSSIHGRTCGVRAIVMLEVAKSQEPRAKSQEPRAKSQEPRAESREPRAESREPRAESREPRAKSPEPRAQSRQPSSESRSPKPVNRLLSYLTKHHTSHSTLL